MTYNKSEIMKEAWSTYRNKSICKMAKINTFADALRYAWSNAKAAVAAHKKIGWVKSNTLNIGDTIKVETLTGDMVSKVIASIKPSALGFAGITVRFEDGSNKCLPKYDPVQRVALAATKKVAA